MTEEEKVEPEDTTNSILFDKVYVLDGHTPVKATSIEDLRFDDTKRIVKQTTITQWGLSFSKKFPFIHWGEEILVSTVFLTIDHGWGNGPPVLFETMVFGGKHGDYQERYVTWYEAEQGHRRAVHLVKGE